MQRRLNNEIIKKIKLFDWGRVGEPSAGARISRARRARKFQCIKKNKDIKKRNDESNSSIFLSGEILRATHDLEFHGQVGPENSSITNFHFGVDPLLISSWERIFGQVPMHEIKYTDLLQENLIIRLCLCQTSVLKDLVPRL